MYQCGGGDASHHPPTMHSSDPLPGHEALTHTFVCVTITTHRMVGRGGHLMKD